MLTILGNEIQYEGQTVAHLAPALTMETTLRGQIVDLLDAGAGADSWFEWHEKEVDDAVRQAEGERDGYIDEVVEERDEARAELRDALGAFERLAALAGRAGLTDAREILAEFPDALAAFEAAAGDDE